MLKSYLTTQPYTKFVLIKDSINDSGKEIFNFLVKSHIDKALHSVHYFVFHGSFARAKTNFDEKNVILHDFASNANQWFPDENSENLESVFTKLSTNDVVIIDSLAHVIYQHGLGETCRLLNFLRRQISIQQVIAVLHLDLLSDREKICSLFEHLCTLNLSIEPKFISENKRAQYTHKKSSGKVIRQTEEYRFEGESLVTQKIEKPDFKKLLERAAVPEVNPETLSTFRIGLNEQEKESRDQLVLPYLPKSETQTDKEEGKIFYEFDDVDDWDEEDPDDDLDI